MIQHALIAFQENVRDSPSHTLDDSDSDCRSEKLNSLIILKLMVLLVNHNVINIIAETLVISKLELSHSSSGSLAATSASATIVQFYSHFDSL